METVPEKTFRHMRYARLEEIIEQQYGVGYNVVNGMNGVRGIHHFMVTTEEPSSYATDEIQDFQDAEPGSYHPSPLVFLKDLAYRGVIPPGHYLIGI
jgi:hypothetical protein